MSKVMTRRRTILLLIVLLVAVGSLWVYVTRPRIDPRLVGKWTVVSIPNRSVFIAPAQMTFKADGSSPVAQKVCLVARCKNGYRSDLPHRYFSGHHTQCETMPFLGLSF